MPATRATPTTTRNAICFKENAPRFGEDASCFDRAFQGIFKSMRRSWHSQAFRSTETFSTGTELDRPYGPQWTRALTKQLSAIVLSIAARRNRGKHGALAATAAAQSRRTGEGAGSSSWRTTLSRPAFIGAATW